MKSIILSGADKEAIMEFVKQHEELYDRTNDCFKDKQKRKTLGNTSIYLEHTCQHSQEVVRDSMNQICQAHIRRKGVSMFKSPLRPSASTATASVPDYSRETESEMIISMTSDVTHQSSSTSPK